MAEHPFWFLLVAACVAWYATITIYVAVRGSFDIRQMLSNLRDDTQVDRDAKGGNHDG